MSAVPGMEPHTNTGAWAASDELPDALRDCAPWWLASLDRALFARDYPAAAEAPFEAPTGAFAGAP